MINYYVLHLVIKDLEDLDKWVISNHQYSPEEEEKNKDHVASMGSWEASSDSRDLAIRKLVG